MSALQTHSNLWLFGWMINKNAAHACFCKQFHIYPFINFDLKEDSVIKKAKQELLKDHTKQVLLQYKSYRTDDESIILNGSTMTYHVRDKNDLMEIAHRNHTTYEYVNLVIYAIAFPGVLLFNFILYKCIIPRKNVG